jgi:GMP synthase (glutamine-hydrolysing)
MLRLLVVDAYDAAGRARLRGAGGTEAGRLYERLLGRVARDAEVVVFHASEPGAGLPQGAALGDFDGVIWTGSNLSVGSEEAAVRGHVALVRATFAAGVPSFGSCWAVHVAVTAAGGRCEANPRGREYGIARKIVLNQAGSAHPMFAGKPIAFDALTSHEDHVVAVGQTTTVLATNEFSAVQAVHVECGRGTFWAVQYHPEYDLIDVAQLGILRAPQLINQGFFRDTADAEAYLKDLNQLHADRSRKDLLYRLAVGADVLDERTRRCEARNWLERMVKPAARD